MNIISPKLKFVMKIFFKPIMTSALLSDDPELPTLDSFWYMTSQIGLQNRSTCVHVQYILQGKGPGIKCTHVRYLKALYLFKYMYQL